MNANHFDLESVVDKHISVFLHCLKVDNVASLDIEENTFVLGIDTIRDRASKIIFISLIRKKEIIIRRTCVLLGHAFSVNLHRH